MESMDYRHILEVTQKQEELLRFDHFTCRDAWELGSFMVKRIYEMGIDMSVAIRKISGYILFQHGTEHTSLNNQNWMQRKFNAVVTMESSSLGCWAASNITGETARVHGLDDENYVFCGGGFPIRLKTGELVAVLTVSNLPHEQDHRFIIDSLIEWLHMDNVPV